MRAQEPSLHVVMTCCRGEHLGETASLAAQALELALECGLLNLRVALLLHRRLQLRLRRRQLFPAHHMMGVSCPCMHPGCRQPRKSVPDLLLPQQWQPWGATDCCCSPKIVSTDCKVQIFSSGVSGTRTVRQVAHLVFSRSFLRRSAAWEPPLELLDSDASSCFSFCTSSRCFCLLGAQPQDTPHHQLPYGDYSSVTQARKGFGPSTVQIRLACQPCATLITTFAGAWHH